MEAASKSLALVRIVIRESRAHLSALTRYFRLTGRPFVIRPDNDSSPAGPSNTKAIELFVVPIDIERLSQILKRKRRPGVQVVLCVDTIPCVFMMRTGEPQNPNLPHLDWLPYLELLPVWKKRALLAAATD